VRSKASQMGMGLSLLEFKMIYVWIFFKLVIKLYFDVFILYVSLVEKILFNPKTTKNLIVFIQDLILLYVIT